jgi:hypothetical protein
VHVLIPIGSFEPLPHQMDSYHTVQALVDWDGTLWRITTVTRPRVVYMTVATTNIGSIDMVIEDAVRRPPVVGQWILHVQTLPLGIES